MATQVIMPQLGESVVEGTVSRWLKQAGETIEAFEPLLEISTDKVETEIPAPAGGTVLQILVAEGATVRKGTVLALIGQPEEAASAVPDAGLSVSHHNGASAAQAPALHPDQAGGAPFVTPVVARMAADSGVDLARITGTGRGGRVTKKDVERFLAGEGTEEPPPWEQPGSGDLFKPTEGFIPAPQPPMAEPQLKPARATEPAASDGELMPLTAMRRAIAQQMERSAQSAPQVTTIFEIDMTAVSQHRQAHQARARADGVHLTFTAYFAVAAVMALRAVPAFNSEWTEGGVYQHSGIRLGVAVALEDGLVVPVIRAAGDLNLFGLARAINDLTARARGRQLQPDDLRDGTFTISNHGIGGSLVATPLLNPPQAGILGTGAIEKRVRVIEGPAGDSIAIRPCCFASLSFDHRVADGAEGDAFMRAFKSALEGWSQT